jgi:hypothetical protein
MISYKSVKGQIDKEKLGYKCLSGKDNFFYQVFICVKGSLHRENVSVSHFF